MELERKFARFGGDLCVTDGATISGYASVFGLGDQGGDIVEAGAYECSLDRLASEGRRVKMLWQHDPATPIGVWDEVREDARGLFVKGRLLTEVQQGADAAKLIQAGAIDGLSIGYRTKRARKDDAGNRHLLEVELWEVSLVTFPMQSAARVSSKAEDLSDEMRGLAEAFESARASLSI